MVSTMEKNKTGNEDKLDSFSQVSLPKNRERERESACARACVRENMCVAVCKYVVKCADLSCVGFWECMCMCDSMTVRQCQCHFVRGGINV